MAESKQQLVAEVVRAQIKDALASMVMEGTIDRNVAVSIRDSLTSRTVSRLCYDRYRWLELCDIFAWRKRKVAD